MGQYVCWYLWAVVPKMFWFKPPSWFYCIQKWLGYRPQGETCWGNSATVATIQQLPLWEQKLCHTGQKKPKQWRAWTTVNNQGCVRTKSEAAVKAGRVARRQRSRVITITGPIVWLGWLWVDHRSRTTEGPVEIECCQHSLTAVRKRFLHTYPFIVLRPVANYLT